MIFENKSNNPILRGSPISPSECSYLQGNLPLVSFTTYQGAGEPETYLSATSELELFMPLRDKYIPVHGVVKGIWTFKKSHVEHVKDGPSVYLVPSIK